MLFFSRNICVVLFSLLLPKNGSGLDQQNLEDVPAVVVRLGIVCDKEYSQNFNHDQRKMQAFLEHEIQDVQVLYQTLQSVTVKFRLSYVLSIESTAGQPFIENSRVADESTPLGIVHDEFQKWVMQNETLVNADAIILFTGSSGQYVAHYVEVASACKLSKLARQFNSLIVARSRPSAWFRSKALALTIGHVLGAVVDGNTACKDFHGVMDWDSPSNPNSYFFSSCSDAAIRQFVESPQASCLQNTQKTTATHDIEGSSIPLTIQERCQLEYNKSAESVVADINVSSCFSTGCYVKTASSYEFLGPVYPIYNTPCGQKEFCFRGRCLPPGIPIMHLNTQKCLLQSNKFTDNDSVKMKTCPESPSKHDEFMILHSPKLGFHYLATTIDTIENFDKCLALDAEGVALTLEKCPSTSVARFGWDLYKVGKNDSNLNFLICHHSAQKCLVVDENMTVTLNDLDILTDTKYRWTAYNSDSYLNSVLDRQLNYNTSVLPVKSRILKQGTTPWFLQSGIWLYILYAVLCVITLTGIIMCVIKITRRKITDGNIDMHNHSRSYLLHNNFYKGALEKINPDLGVASQAEFLPFDKRWEFPEEKLTLGKQLGSGAFGSVVQANAIGILEESTKSTVAVKMVRENANESHLKALMSELKIMSHLGQHINIVNLLGACTKKIEIGQLKVIIEFCSNGNLRSYMHRYRRSFEKDYSGDATLHQRDPTIAKFFNPKPTNQSTSQFIQINEGRIPSEELLVWGFQVAKGMEYLASRRVLHGDLAARNCLVSENNVVKLCDFGFSKTLQRDYDYNYQKNVKGALLPFKWMAIESIRSGIFSSETDCWSFGILLWEIFTLGDTPYPGLPIDKKFIDDLTTGYRMERPSLAPSRVYDIMLQCWADDPKQRPTFPSLVIKLGKMLGDEVCDYYFQLNSDYQRMNFGRFLEGTDLLLQMGKSEIRQSFFPTDSAGYLLSSSGSYVNESSCTRTQEDLSTAYISVD